MNRLFSNFIRTMSLNLSYKLFQGNEAKIKKVALLSIGSFGAWYLMQQFHPIQSNSLKLPNNFSARTPSYGSKFNGIVAVEKYLQNNPIERVKIPLSKGLSDELVYLLLSTKAPEIFTKWENLNRGFETCTDKGRFLSDPEVLKTLSEIEKMIVSVFKKLSKKELASLAKLDDLDRWLQDLQEKGSYIMVRSSSIEDLQGMPNAGGNLSEEYVDPNPRAVLDSAARVIGSYFGVASLRNQIDVGINPFKRMPALSVMLQELIGEEIGGAKDPNDIPVSLVLFTTEPADSENEFRLTKISSAYGHGSGVVNFETINTDRVHFTLLKNGKILEAYQNRLKQFRLAPVRDFRTGKVSLVPLPNPAQLQTKRSINPETIQRLSDLSEYLEQAFQQPMDVEIVIKRGYINIVQVRPINRPATKNASYVSAIHLEKARKNPVLNDQMIKVLITSKAATEIITDPSQILVCDTLKQAEDIPGSKSKLAVIVGVDEENTHPIVNFGSHGVTCLYTKDLQKVRMLSEKISPDFPLVICPQSGVIYLWDKSIVDPQDCIKEGRFSHTASIGFSLTEKESDFPFEPLERGRVPKDLESLVQTLKASRTNEVARQTLFQIKTIVSHDIEKAKRSYSVFKSSQRSAVLEKLEKTIGQVFQGIEKEQGNHTRKLFLISSLEKLLGKQPSGSLYTYSLLDARKLSQEADKILAYRSKLSLGVTPRFENLLPYAEVSHSLEGKKLWEEFLLGLEKASFFEISYKKQQLDSFLNSLEEHKVLALFMNLICLPILVDSQDPIKTLDELLSHANLDVYLLKTLKQKNGQILRIKNSLELFQDPKTFRAAWKDLLQLLKFFNEDTLFHPMEELSSIPPPATAYSTINFAIANDSLLVKLLLIEALREVVDLTDQAIKTMKQSSLFSEEIKVALLEEMVNENANLLKVWLTNPFLKNAFTFVKNWNLDKYLKDMIDAVVKRSLEPSRDFSVMAAVINAGTLFERHLPETLDDRFTLIHQNQIAVVQILLSKCLTKDTLSKIPKSPLFQKAIQELQSLDNSTLDGISLTTSGLAFSYNIPLRNHSVRIAIEQTNEGELILRANLLGPARHRWPELKNYIEALSFAKGIPLVGYPYLIENELSFNWCLESEDQVVFAKNLLSLFLEYSMDWGGGDSIVEAAKKRNLQAAMGQWYIKNGKSSTISKAFVRTYFESSWPLSLFWILGLEDHFKSYGLSSNPKTLDDQLDNLIFLSKLFPLILSRGFINFFPYVGNFFIPAIENFLRREVDLKKLIKLINNLQYENGINLPVTLILEHIEKRIETIEREDVWSYYTFINAMSKAGRISEVDKKRFEKMIEFLKNSSF